MSDLRACYPTLYHFFVRFFYELIESYFRMNLNLIIRINLDLKESWSMIVYFISGTQLGKSHRGGGIFQNIGHSAAGVGVLKRAAGENFFGS